MRFSGDRMPAIGSFFYSQVRTGAFSTEATNTFHYAPATSDVSRAVVEEGEKPPPSRPTRPARPMCGKSSTGKCQNNSFFAVQPGARFNAGCCTSRHSQQSRRRGPGRRRPRHDDGRNGRRGRRRNGRNGKGEGGQAFEFLGIKKKRNVGRHRVRHEAEPEVEALGEIEEPDLKEGADKDSSRWDLKGESRMGMRSPLASSRARAYLPSRQRFAETAYWNPSVVTGKDGKAQVKFKAPRRFPSTGSWRAA